MGVGGPWRVSTDELMDKNLPYFVGGNLATLVEAACRSGREDTGETEGDVGAGECVVTTSVPISRRRRREIRAKSRPGVSRGSALSNRLPAS